MQNPANLEVTHEALALAMLTYRATEHFPPAERNGLSAQMRRAAVSVGSNIAEGCGRRGNAALSAFLYVALGSVSELLFQAELARELGLGNAADHEALIGQATKLSRMLSRLIVSLRRRGDVPGGFPPRPARDD